MHRCPARDRCPIHRPGADSQWTRGGCAIGRPVGSSGDRCCGLALTDSLLSADRAKRRCSSGMGHLESGGSSVYRAAARTAPASDWQSAPSGAPSSQDRTTCGCRRPGRPLRSKRCPPWPISSQRPLTRGPAWETSTVSPAWSASCQDESGGGPGRPRSPSWAIRSTSTWRSSVRCQRRTGGGSGGARCAGNPDPSWVQRRIVPGRCWLELSPSASLEKMWRRQCSAISTSHRGRSTCSSEERPSPVGRMGLLRPRRGPWRPRRAARTPRRCRPSPRTG